ncbi:MAG: peptide chain release factor 1 [Rhodospirillales bacterium]|jgi:peptide chain release factor 1|nr:peptide chain release factor 1 [Rhodospirillaceae bacterium]MDP6426941.1 peptide chain release factor 1 [Rhodospirillales bacterium]MDP6645357.1 peptide chain release factor 1 [Rhodospirillales bacterium]MDP6842824.1 peptide chain release factor 1 [Rhodospirillales bacterium]
MLAGKLTDKLDRVIARHDELRDTLASGENLDGGDYGRMSKELSDLSVVVEAVNEYRSQLSELDDLISVIEDADTEPEMKDMIGDEMREITGRLPELERRVQILLLPKDEADEKDAILEVRAGTGGDEAALFAADLFRMYQRFAERHGWTSELISLNETGIGGFKEAVMGIRGRNVFQRLKFESGVHRVQRVPETESQGRVHTSAATVAVLPEAEEVDIDIDTGDLRVDTYRAQGAGGQHVNKTDSAVRITHIPSNIVVQCQDNKSQHKNRATAMKLLRARLYEAERQRKDSARAADRKNQVGSGDRSERIRTYNFPQGRITDHRISLTIYKLDKFMDGELDEMVDALITDDEATQLAELEV